MYKFMIHISCRLRVRRFSSIGSKHGPNISLKVITCSLVFSCQRYHLEIPTRSI